MHGVCLCKHRVKEQSVLTLLIISQDGNDNCYDDDDDDEECDDDDDKNCDDFEDGKNAHILMTRAAL